MSIEQDLLDLANIKVQVEALNAAKAAIEVRLVDEFTKVGLKTARAQTPAGGEVQGTLVAGTRVVIDEDRLKKALGAATWKKVTKQVLDKDQLEARVTTGEIDPQVVAAASDVKDIKPYIKVTRDKAPAPPVPSTQRKVKPRKRSQAAKKVTGKAKP